jgi:hypothetical protein
MDANDMLAGKQRSCVAEAEQSAAAEGRGELRLLPDMAARAADLEAFDESEGDLLRPGRAVQSKVETAGERPLFREQSVERTDDLARITLDACCRLGKKTPIDCPTPRHVVPL